MRSRFVQLAVLVPLLAACSDEDRIVAPEAPLPAAAASVPAASLADLGVPLTGRYILLAKKSLPTDLAGAVAPMGGTLEAAMPQIGVAIVTGDAGFAQRAADMNGVESVTPDLLLQWTDPDPGRVGMELDAVPGGGVGQEVASFADNAFFHSFQWAPAAIQAPEAWNLGYTGAGVRVAIVDGGLYEQHLDLAPNIDVAASASFVPGFAYNQDTGTFWHGTHVAGIVGSSGLIGTAGIAPEATLIGVKVLHSGSGAFEWVLNGLLYAATPVAQGGGGAHIINMSLGATFNYRDNWQDKAFRDAFRELAKAFDRAVSFAYQQGVTVIASAGNGATNFDAARELFKIPGENQHVVGVSATGPHGWALAATDFERPGFYSDFGKSLVDVGAPGGTPGLFVIDGVDQACTVTGTFTSVTTFCEVFDMVISTVRGSAASVASYNWAYGTSMAAPAVSGVAALIIQANGGSMNPHAVASALKSSAVDLGKPGKDEFYGHGWVNALRAVTR